MSCIYYKAKGDHDHCMKCHKEVCTDWYHRYCQNYNYDACIIYKEKSDKYYHKPGDIVLMEWKKEKSFKVRLLKGFFKTENIKE